MTRVVAVCGSRRDGSYTRVALGHALDAASEAGAETDLLDLGAVDLPLYHPDVDIEEQGEAAALVARIREADGVLLGSPVYHGSYSSTFRNFHDYCGFDEYEDTVVGLLATAGGGSYGSTLDHMRATVRGVHGWVVPHQVGIRRAYDQFDADGAFVDPALEERVAELGRVVVERARDRAAPRASD
ncbi:NADPH-dependent FMN reductase [Halomarina litorea]|uniref:NADPH-dependent FMN reductase n=1 Tax=Halomarina litorea TaxID=2961595 RepID=UPI0020C4AAD1|nr:NAD(P)H-dependent oxidoreductase [Halomarina sp. BCD28]